MRSQLPRSPRAHAVARRGDVAGDAAQHRLEHHPVESVGARRSATTSWPGTNGNDTMGSK